jgi:hypothetical protein
MSGIMFSPQDNEFPFISQEVNMRINFSIYFVKQLPFFTKEARDAVSESCDQAS